MVGHFLVGPLPPPGTLQAYYEASLNTLDATDVAADNFEKLKTWNLANGSLDHPMVQATVGNQLRVRKTTAIPLVYSNFDEEVATAAMTASLSIDQRAATFFALVELDILKVNSVATERIIMSLPGGRGRPNFVHSDRGKWCGCAAVARCQRHDDYHD